MDARAVADVLTACGQRVLPWVMLALLSGTTAWLGWQARDVDRRLAQQQQHVVGLAELLHGIEGRALQRGELIALRDELGKELSETGERVRALEAGSAAAVSRVIAGAAASVVYLQGGYGFEDRATRRLLRMAVDKNGQVLHLSDGRPQLTLDGAGPPARTGFSGTAFVVDTQGLLLTNRHVVRPWEDESALPALQAMGLEPVILELRGYLPGASEPVDVAFVRASEAQDVALLRAQAIASTPPLRLSSQPTQPGDTAIMLGYPTGLRALVARASDDFVKELRQRSTVSPEELARELARAGMVQPLASRGIVGQVAPDAIVYDAQTTSGGSGAPVLNLAGDVIAINRATLPEFGGSNLGVPVRHALELLSRVHAEAVLRPTAGGR
jgi:serine protease Do